MESFAYILILTVVLLIGNLARLLYCTIKNYKRAECRNERIHGVGLFVMYLVITSFFCWFAFRAICNILCETPPLW